MTSTPPASGYYGDNNEITFKVTFSGSVTVTGTPRFSFDIGGNTRQAGYTSGSGSAELVFTYTVSASDDVDDHDGISWEADSLSLNGGTMKYNITEVAQREDAVLDHPAQGPLSAHKVDTRKPVIHEAEFDDDEVYLIYSENLNTTAPANTAFSVAVDGGTGVNPTGVSVSEDVVTLTLASEVARGATVTVTYTTPLTNPIRDLSGKEAEDFGPLTASPATDLVNFRATPGDRRVTLEWDLLTDGALTRYQYRYCSTDDIGCPTEDSGWNPDWTNVQGSSASTTSHTARNLVNGLEYTFEVRPVYTKGGQTEYGREDEVKSAPRGALVAPRGLSAARGGTGELILSWDDPKDVTLTGYEYRYRIPADSDWNPDWTEIAEAARPRPLTR